MIVFDRLWDYLETHEITVYRLREDAELNHKTIGRLRANENVETKILDRICKALHCSLEDIAEYIKEDDA